MTILNQDYFVLLVVYFPLAYLYGLHDCCSLPLVSFTEHYFVVLFLKERQYLVFRSHRRKTSSMNPSQSQTLINLAAWITHCSQLGGQACPACPAGTSKGVGIDFSLFIFPDSAQGFQGTRAATVSAEQSLGLIQRLSSLDSIPGRV